MIHRGHWVLCIGTLETHKNSVFEAKGLRYVTVNELPNGIILNVLPAVLARPGASQ